jgi:hypothetical protein
MLYSSSLCSGDQAQVILRYCELQHHHKISSMDPILSHFISSLPVSLVVILSSYSIFQICAEILWKTLKLLFYYSVCKIHIFATLLSYLTLLTGGIEKWKYGNSRETREKTLCFVHQSHGLPLQLKENIGLSVAATKRLHRSWDTECIQLSVSS